MFAGVRYRLDRYPDRCDHCPAIRQDPESRNRLADVHDLSSTRFSMLKQITASNVGKLKLTWSMPYRANRNSAAADGLGGLTEATPVVINGLRRSGRAFRRSAPAA
jgi:glucose dehydrogenase